MPRTRTRSRASTPLAFGLGTLLVTLVLVGVAIGSVPMPVDRVLAVFGDRLGLGAHASAIETKIVWDLRLPRVLLAALVGAALALAGAALQGLVRNPLADPYILGVTSGASLGAVAVMTAGAGVLAAVSVPVAAFACAVASLALVYGFAQRSGSFTDTRIVLAGVAIGYVAMAATSFLQLQADPGELRGILFWTMGSVAAARWDTLVVPAVVVAAVGLWLVASARGLNALALGDDAQAVGLDLRRFRLGLLVAAAALTAVAVSVAGGVGFVGIIVPHAVRLVVGGDHRRLLPLSALAGAVFLVAVDVVARTIDAPNEYPLTIFTAAVGGPFFLWLMRRGQRR